MRRGLSYWTKLMSQVVDIQVETVESAYSGQLEVICRKGRYALCTPNAVYSYDDLYYNFKESFERIDLEAFKIQKVLVLGLGLGSIPLLLETKFNKKYLYTFVEIDKNVVNLAKEYTLQYLQSPYQIIVEDALQYSQSTTETFDFIAVDLFIDNLVPSAFETEAFLQQLKQRLNPNGLLMYNRLSYTPALMEKTVWFYEQVFQSVFDGAALLELGDNRMLLNCLAPLSV